MARYLISLQSQNFNNIEIILVDDFSKDNSVVLIKEFQKRDQRIILIKNRKNKGTFVTRNIGVLLSKGKYLIVPDPDDILSKNILKSCYKLAQKYNYDIIRFNIIFKSGKLDFNQFVNDIKKGPIYQPELSSYIFYGSKKLRLSDFYIYNKIIKKEVFIKALNILNKHYLNLYMTFYEDGLINYFIHLEAKSLYFLKSIGYFYLRNSESVTHNKYYKYKKLKAKFLFIYLKFVFEYSKNAQYNKDAVNAILLIFTSYFNIPNILSRSDFKKDFNFYKGIINKFLNSEFIKNEIKKNLKKIKENIEKKEKDIFISQKII